MSARRDLTRGFVLAVCTRRIQHVLTPPAREVCVCSVKPSSWHVLRSFSSLQVCWNAFCGRVSLCVMDVDACFLRSINSFRLVLNEVQRGGPRTLFDRPTWFMFVDPSTRTLRTSTAVSRLSVTCYGYVLMFMER